MFLVYHLVSFCQNFYVLKNHIFVLYNKQCVKDFIINITNYALTIKHGDYRKSTLWFDILT